VEKNLGGTMSQWGRIWQINDVVFIVSDALTFSGFGGMDFHDLNLLKHGPWLMKYLHTSIFHGAMLHVLCGINDFILISHLSNNGLAVDAGHQMKKDKVVLYVLPILGGAIS
jgi:cytochrome c oxidase subunit 3